MRWRNQPGTRPNSAAPVASGSASAGSSPDCWARRTRAVEVVNGTRLYFSATNSARAGSRCDSAQTWIAMRSAPSCRSGLDVRQRAVERREQGQRRFLLGSSVRTWPRRRRSPVSAIACDELVLALEVPVDHRTERPASLITSCIEVRWKPFRRKQPAVQPRGSAGGGRRGVLRRPVARETIVKRRFVLDDVTGPCARP